MRLYLSCSEQYPMYDLFLEDNYGRRVVEVSREEYESILYAQTQYERAQSILKKKWDEAKND